jgi:glutamate dehydrogenase
VDLLYNGGIGTYVKASAEQHAEVGDRTNDRLRIDARAVRARVVGEGGNLGFTQKARLEYWAGGGLINTDAIDNSGGVDISDHEVNLKILMADLIAKGELASREERNRVLAEMTEEVAELVLQDNRDQARALTLDGMRSGERFEEFIALIDDMESTGILNRTDDAIPSRDELLAAPTRERGLPRPLLALLLGETKIWAYDLALQADVLDGERGRPFLEGYFPARIRERWAAHLASHPLRREIATTAAVNHIVNNAGAAYLARVTNASGRSLGDVVAAYLEVDRESAADEIRQEILGAGLRAAEEHELLLEVEFLVEDLVLKRLEGRAVRSQATLEQIRARLRPAG